MAYGTGECTNLAMNDFPDNESDMAIHNADNYAYIAAGMSYKYPSPLATLRVTPRYPVSFLHLHST